MAKNSKIEWTTHTFNPWRGCFKVSAGCSNCYAEISAPSRVARGKGIETWGKNASRIVASESMWREPERWNREAEDEIDAELHDFSEDGYVPPERPRVFCASLADVFEDYQGGKVGPIRKDGTIDNVFDDLTLVRLRLFDLIYRTPCLDWLLLTKRPENVEKMLREVYEICRAHNNPNDPNPLVKWLRDWLTGNPPHNVWMGTTVEDQENAEKRIPALLDIPARVRFLSCEPMLGAVDLRPRTPSGFSPWLRGIDWVICGGESGAKARPMSPEWALSLRDQCRAAGVPFLFKQWGEWAPLDNESSETGLKYYFCDGLVATKVGKKAAGRLLDGVEHNGFPEA